MTYLWLAVLFCTSISAETLSPLEHNSLHTYNKRFTFKHESEKRAHQLHKIDEKKARSIAQNVCKESSISLKLTHHELYLYYIAHTKKCTVYINALDGTIIDPKRIKTKVLK